MFEDSITTFDQFSKFVQRAVVSLCSSGRDEFQFYNVMAVAAKTKSRTFYESFEQIFWAVVVLVAVCPCYGTKETGVIKKSWEKIDIFTERANERSLYCETVQNFDSKTALSWLG